MDIDHHKTSKELKINRINPNSISPAHVNDMLVGHDGKEFYLQFSEIEPPLVLDDQQLNALDSIDAIVKVKLVMGPEFAEAVIKALSESIEKFKLLRKSDRD